LSLEFVHFERAAWFKDLLKKYRSPFENLRANGTEVEIIAAFSVRAEPVEALRGFLTVQRGG